MDDETEIFPVQILTSNRSAYVAQESTCKGAFTKRLLEG